MTNFPNQIDSFDIKLPQEVIKSDDINQLGEALTAVQVFVKSLEEGLDNHIIQEVSAHLASSIALDSSLNGDEDVLSALQTLDGLIDGHIAQTTAVHDASAISMSAITGVDTTNAQTAIEDLKVQIDLVDVLNVDITAFNAHLADMVNPHGVTPVQIGAYLTSEVDALITDVKDGYTAADTAEAITRAAEDQDIRDGYEAGDILLQSNMDSHTLASEGVHGLDGYSSVVGTKKSQTLEQKKILSDFQGSKVLLWIDSVEDEEKEIYDLSTPSANQIEVRQQSVDLISAVAHPGGGTSNSVITVGDSSFFANADGQVNGVNFVIPPSTLLATATIVSRDAYGANTLELDSVYPSILTTAVAVNNLNSTPLFYVDETGKVHVSELEVANGTFQDIELNDDVSISGSLTVDGTTSLGANTDIIGDLQVTGQLTVGTSTTTIDTNSLTTSNLFATNDLDVGGFTTLGDQLVVTGRTLLNENLEVAGNGRVDGYLNVGQDSIFLGGLNVSNFLTASSVSAATMAAETLTVQDTANITNDLTVGGNIIVDGYISPAKVASYTDATRPFANIVGKGTIIFNDDDLTLNVSDGYDWRDMLGIVT